MSEPTRIDPLARNVAGFGLRGETGLPLEIDAEDWTPFLGLLSAQRLTGLAEAAADSGSLRLTEEQSAELRTRQRDAMVWSLFVEQKLLRVRRAFENAKIPIVVLKGPAIAHTAYPDPAWRPFGDIDVLVPTADWSHACDLLGGLGYGRDVPEPLPGFDTRFGKAAMWTNDDRIEVDVHRTLVVGPHGLWADPAEVMERTTSLSLGGQSLLRLDDTAMLLHACMHAVLGWWPPLWWTLRDVAQLAWSGRVDAGDLMTLTTRWRLHAVVELALEQVRRTLQVELPPDLVDGLELHPTRQERRALASYVTRTRWRSGPAVSTLAAIPGFRAKAAYVRAMLFPGRAFMASRRTVGGEGSYVRRLLVPMRWLSARRG